MIVKNNIWVRIIQREKLGCRGEAAMASTTGPLCSSSPRPPGEGGNIGSFAPLVGRFLVGIRASKPSEPRVVKCRKHGFPKCVPRSSGMWVHSNPHFPVLDVCCAWSSSSWVADLGHVLLPRACCVSSLSGLLCGASMDLPSLSRQGDSRHPVSRSWAGTSVIPPVPYAMTLLCRDPLIPLLSLSLRV